MVSKVSDFGGISPVEGPEIAKGKKLVEEVDDVRHSDEVEEDCEPNESKRKIENFLKDDQALDVLFKKEPFFNRFMAVISHPILLFGIGSGFLILSLPFLLKGAFFTAATLGAGAPVGVPVMSIGVILAGLGTASWVYGIERSIRGIAIDKSSKRSEISPELRKKIARASESSTRKETRMKLLAAKIKYDHLLSPAEKTELLEPYTERRLRRADVKELSSAYLERHELNLLKKLFSEKGAKDLADLKETKLEEFYKKAKERGADLNLKNELTGVRQWRGRRKQIKELIDGYGGDAHFWKRLAAIDGQITESSI